MANNVDQQIVQMKMQSSQFERDADKVITILQTIQDILPDKASMDIDFSAMSKSIDNISKKFTGLGAVATLALIDITRQVESAAATMAKSLTIKPALAGFQEYETQMNSVQTILANTGSKEIEVSKESIEAINKKAAADIEARETANEKALAALRKRQEEELYSYKKTSSEEIDIIKDQYDEQINIIKDQYDEYDEVVRDSISAEQEKLQEQHDEKMQMYDDEYMAKLKAVDEDRYNAIKQIDDQIDSINNLTKAEDEELKRQREQQKLQELQQAVKEADTTEDRKYAEEELAEYKKELEREQLLEARDRQIESLEEQKDSINEQYDQIYENIQNEYEQKVNSENEYHQQALENLYEQSEMAQVYIQEQKDAELKALQEQRDLELRTIEDKREANIRAIEEQNDLEIENMKARNEQSLKDIQTQADARIKNLTAQNIGKYTKATTLEEVNAALDELNTYADKTIYNFTEMTRNIGTFTAAGIDLDTSVKSIKGIANLAALSGSNSEQASRAMYQLSQALAAGTVKLMDWNSVVNAGMGGQVFQDSLKETAKVHGIEVDAMIAKAGSFRESLQSGWITADILNETLAKFTGDMSKEELQKIGYTEEQITKIMELGKTANDAATKVKTFTQLFDTLAEAAGSGWTNSFEIIIGDFETARNLLTSISDVFSNIIVDSANARNEMLKGWSELGGRSALIEAAKQAWQTLLNIVQPIKKAFTEIFPPMTVQQLVDICNRIKELVVNFQITDETSQKLYTVFKGLFSYISFGVKVFQSIISSMRNFIASIAPLDSIGGGVSDLILKIANFGISLNETYGEASKFGSVWSLIKDAMTNTGNYISQTFTTALDKLKSSLAPLSSTVASVKEAFITMKDSIKTVVGNIGNEFTKFGSLSEGLSAIGNGVSSAALSIGSIALAGNAFEFLRNIFIKVTNIFTKSFNFVENLSRMFGSVTKVLNSFATSIKVDILIKIASAILTLTAALTVLSLLDPNKVTASLGVVFGLLAELFGSIAAFETIMEGSKMVSISAAAKSLEIISKSILILAGALFLIGQLSYDQMEVGLWGITGAMALIITSAAIMSKYVGEIDKSVKYLKSLAITLLLLVIPIKLLGAMPWGELIKGLVSVGVLCATLAGFFKLIKYSIFNVDAGFGLALIELAAAILILCQSVEKLGTIPFLAALQGLVAVAAILGTLAGFMKLTNGLTEGIFKTGAAMLVLSFAISTISKSMLLFKDISLDSISTGLWAIGLSLATIVVMLQGVPKDALQSAISIGVVALAISSLANVFMTLSSLNWSQVVTGLAVIIPSLAMMVVALNALSVTGVTGSIALILCSTALTILAGAFILLSGLSWDAIDRVLLTLVDSLFVLAAAAAIMSPLVPSLLALSVALLSISGSLTLTAIAGTLFGVAINTIVTALTTAITTLSIYYNYLAKIGPSLMKDFEKLIISGTISIITIITTLLKAILAAIRNVVPDLLKTLTVIFKSVLKAIRDVVPDFVETIVYLIDELLKTIANHLPSIIESGWSIIMSILQGIKDHIKDVVTTAIDIVINFVNGISEKIGDVIQAGVNLVISFLEGVGDALKNEENITRMQEAGKNILEGIVKGVTNSISIVWDAMKNVATSCIDAFKSVLGIASPSKVMEKESGYVGEGIVNGLSGKLSAVKEKGKELGSNIIDGLKTGIGDGIDINPFAGLTKDMENTVNTNSIVADNFDTSSFANAVPNMNDILEDGLNTNPVITPEMDLTNVENSSSDINSILNNGASIDVSSTGMSNTMSSTGNCDCPKKEKLDYSDTLITTIPNAIDNVGDNTSKISKTQTLQSADISKIKKTTGSIDDNTVDQNKLLQSVDSSNVINSDILSSTESLQSSKDDISGILDSTTKTAENTKKISKSQKDISSNLTVISDDVSSTKEGASKEDFFDVFNDFDKKQQKAKEEDKKSDINKIGRNSNKAVVEKLEEVENLEAFASKKLDDSMLSAMEKIDISKKFSSLLEELGVDEKDRTKFVDEFKKNLSELPDSSAGAYIKLVSDQIEKQRIENNSMIDAFNSELAGRDNLKAFEKKQIAEDFGNKLKEYTTEGFTTFSETALDTIVDGMTKQDSDIYGVRKKLTSLPYGMSDYKIRALTEAIVNELNSDDVADQDKFISDLASHIDELSAALSSNKESYISNLKSDSSISESQALLLEDVFKNNMNADAFKDINTYVTTFGNTLTAINFNMQNVVDGMKVAANYLNGTNNSLSQLNLPSQSVVQDLSNFSTASSGTQANQLGSSSYSNVKDVGGQMEVSQQIAYKEFDDTDILRSINEVRTEIANLSDELKNMNVTLDSDTLVGRMAPKLDSALGFMAKLAGRGVR